MPLANVALTDTFDTWRTRTNQIIVLSDGNETRSIAAFDKANTSGTDATNAYGTANAAFAKANTANTDAIAAFTQANTAGTNAIAAFGKANTAGTDAVSAYGQANTARTHANSAFAAANTAGIDAGAAFGQANTARDHANAAFNAANTIVLDPTYTGNITATGPANTIVIKPADSATAANTITINQYANVGLGIASPAYKLDVDGSVNASALLINGTPVSGAISLTTDDTTNDSYYITFSSANTGSVESINVANALYFNPSTGTLSATIFNSLSDETLKKDVKTIENALNKVDSVRGVSFRWKTNDQPSLGVIAQEIEKIAPELITEMDGIKNVNYDGIIGILIESIKDLKARVEKLENNG